MPGTQWPGRGEAINWNAPSGEVRDADPTREPVAADNEAREKRLHLDSLVHYDSGIASLSIALGHDASKFDPDAPLPEIPESNDSKTGRAQAISLAARENLTVRQLAQRYGGYSGLAFVGTPGTVAAQMENWLSESASDGFMLVFPYLPQGLEEVTSKLIPELRRRGLFRTEYEGETLRENLGLPRPHNQFFESDHRLKGLGAKG